MYHAAQYRVSPNPGALVEAQLYPRARRSQPKRLGRQFCETNLLKSCKICRFRFHGPCKQHVYDYISVQAKRKLIGKPTSLELALIAPQGHNDMGAWDF